MSRSDCLIKDTLFWIIASIGSIDICHDRNLLVSPLHVVPTVKFVTLTAKNLKADILERGTYT